CAKARAGVHWCASAPERHHAPCTLAPNTWCLVARPGIWMPSVSDRVTLPSHVLCQALTKDVVRTTHLSCRRGRRGAQSSSPCTTVPAHEKFAEHWEKRAHEHRSRPGRCDRRRCRIGRAGRGCGAGRSG